MSDADSWTVVRDRRTARSHAGVKRSQGPRVEREVRWSANRLLTSVDECMESIAKVSSELVDDPSWRSVVSALSAKDGFVGQIASECSEDTTEIHVRILAYGIGSPMSSESSRAQLALLQLLQKWLEAVHSTDVTISHPLQTAIECYDPLFGADDHTILEKMRMKPSTSNDWVDPYDISTDNQKLCFVVIYAPHCERHVFQECLRYYASLSNSFHRLCIIGNSFEAYDDRTVKQMDRDECAIIQLFGTLTTERKRKGANSRRQPSELQVLYAKLRETWKCREMPMQTGSVCPDAFTDLAIHTFAERF